MLLKIKYLVLVIKSKKLTTIQKLMKLKRKLLIIIMIFAARLKQVNLASKRDSVNFVNKRDFHDKVKNVTSNKNELNSYQKKFKQFQQKHLEN